MTKTKTTAKTTPRTTVDTRHDGGYVQVRRADGAVWLCPSASGRPVFKGV